MLDVRRLFALHAVCAVGIAVAAAAAAPPAAGGVRARAGHSAAAQIEPAPGALGEMPLPGGLRGALAAAEDRAAADRSQFLLDFIRRSYDTPIRVKSDPREPLLRALVARLANEQTAGPVGSPETLPLPLPAAVWIDVVFGGRATSQNLAAQILQSRNASLLYYGLLSLDDATRAWLATEPDLIADLAERHPAAFAAVAPGLRVVNDGLRVPGGDIAAPAWQALVGRRPAERVEFLRALISQGDGRLAYFFGAMALLTPAQIRFALKLDAPDAADRVGALRQMYDALQALGPGWNIEERAFWRPGLDPVLLAAELRVDDDGRPIVPGTRRFWTAVLGDVNHLDPDQARALAAGDPVDLAWLCEQIFKGPSVAHRRRYQAVMFASRSIARLTPEDAGDAFEAVRAVGGYPALVGVLERAKVTELAVFARAARRAAQLSAINDTGRAVRALAQFQGALAVLTRGAVRGSVPAGALSGGVLSLSAIELGPRGDYDGRVVRWLAEWMDTHQRNPSATPAAGLQSVGPVSEDDLSPLYANAPGPLDANVLRMLSGPPVSTPPMVDWEGTRYRLDLTWTEARRLDRRLGEHARPYLSSAQALVMMADALADAGLTLETLRREARVFEQVAQAVEWDGHRTSNDVPDMYREVASVLGPGGDTNVRRASRLAPGLRRLADELLARGLTELTYAVAMGQPERASISAWQAARRHDFGLQMESLGRAGAWQFPGAGTDSLSGRGWRVVGSLLGLDVKLAELSLVRLSSKLPSNRPMLQDVNRRVLIEAVALVEAGSLTEADRETLVAAIRRGRARLAAIRTPAEALALVEEIRLGPARRTLLPWVIAHEPGRVAAFLSPSELLWVGLGTARVKAGLDSWGAPGEPRLGCLCLRLIHPQVIDTLAGRWSFGMLASAFPDLNLRLAELLTELNMPAALLGPVLTSATLDFIDTAVSRDQDDRRGLVEFVQALGVARVEQYLALLTTDGPLVPIADGAGPPASGTGGTDARSRTMTGTWAGTLTAIGLVSLAVSAQTDALRITSPAADTIVSGVVRLEAAITPAELAASVQSVTFFVNGRLACTVERPPFGCNWNPGDVVRGHHIRAVATLTDGRRLPANVRTKDLGYVEKVKTEAVLVPVIVTQNGEFVRGLKQQDFELFEDGVKHPIASFVNENAPLDLVLAVDISGSMESSLSDVKAAVKQLLSKLRPGDAATLVGFNDTLFVAAEREKDRQTREEAVDLLTSWGGTALYDATVSTLDMVSRDWGRKGVVIFSDGDDRHSLTPREAAMARVQASDAMLYTVGFGAGATVPALRSSLESYARSTGGRPFFPRTVKELDGVFDEIVAELANQYVLSYASTNLKADNAWRNIKVQVRKGKYDVRARRGYRATGPQRAGR